MPGSDYFGPDARFQILADLFEIPLEHARRIGIEPPCGAIMAQTLSLRAPPCVFQYHFRPSSRATYAV